MNPNFDEKPFSLRNITSLVGMSVFLVGIYAGTILVQINQEVREQAASGILLDSSKLPEHDPCLVNPSKDHVPCRVLIQFNESSQQESGEATANYISQLISNEGIDPINIQIFAGQANLGPQALIKTPFLEEEKIGQAIFDKHPELVVYFKLISLPEDLVD